MLTITRRVFVFAAALLVFTSIDSAFADIYLRATGWVVFATDRAENDPSRYFHRTNGYVEEDGKLYPQEDFGNNIEYFIYNPDFLKEQTPSAYLWISREFGGKLSSGGKRNSPNAH
jgi:hypothetical protein